MLTDIRLRYKVELAIAGMVDGPSGGLTPSDKLKRLQEYGNAWGAAELAYEPLSSRAELTAIETAVIHHSTAQHASIAVTY